MGSYPTGTVTLLFADIEGSTRLLQHLQGRFADLLDAYRRTLRDAFTPRGGHEVDLEGDGYFAVFSRAGDALGGAVVAQEAIARYAWPDNVAVRVRMALHTGEPQLVERNYVGIDVHRAARLCTAAHGGQIVLSQSTRALLSDTLPPGIELQDLGTHQLKDFGETRVFQVIAPGLEAEFPPLRSADALHDMLAQVRRSLGRREGHAVAAPSAPATPVIGREQEIAATGAALLAPDIRLLTLTGPPGIGKTRLALEVARALQPHFQATLVVDLSPITDAGLVLYAIASALGLREAGAGLLADRLADHLSGRALLLVLDNFEHVVDAALSVGHLLEGARELKVLVTSRERLRLTWEREFPVPPLAMPDRAQAASLDAMAQVPAVALFLERARAVRADFALTPENAPAVAEICVRLGGLPLAIELCAPRVKVLSPSEISARLQRQLDLLTGGPRDLPPRQRTLRAAIAWSEGLLPAADRVLLRRLGVFVGGWTLEAAHTVCAGADVDVLDGIASLIDKSLVRQVARPDGAVRFGMLEAIREYALEHLEQVGELDTLRDRHTHYFASCASQVEELLLDSRGEASVMGLSHDRDNVLAAIEWAVGRRDGETAFDAASGMAWLWYMRGQLSEGSAWMDRLLAADLPASDRVRMAVLIPAGALAWSGGRFDLATARLHEALRLATAAGKQRTEAMALAFLGNVARSQGDCPRANDLHQRSLALYEQIGNQRGLAWALYDLALDARALRDHDEARRLLEESLRLFEQQDYRWAIAWASWHLGHLALGAGDARGAAECYGRSLALYRGIEDGRGIAQAVEGLGAVAAERQDLEGAARLLGGADFLRTTLGALRDPVEHAPYDAQVRALRGALGDRRFRILWEEGRRLSTAALVDAAQKIAGAGDGAPSPDARPLTAREQQVATLVARGLSNREIAGALRVTERTAVSHIEHIMNKLGVNSRAQIAVWAVRHGLEPVET
jgi:predicted ATPase/class 3 adenylate cyclase/DNA-binding CsgD family transcriptional regulator